MIPLSNTIHLNISRTRSSPKNVLTPSAQTEYKGADGQPRMVPTNIHFNASEMALLMKHFHKITGRIGETYVYKYNDNDHMLVQKRVDELWLAIKDTANNFHFSARIDRTTGRIILRRGMQYPECKKDGPECETSLTAYIAEHYVYEQLVGTTPPKDLDNKDVQRTARRIWEYLQKFPFKDNDRIYLPQFVEKRGTADCDDVALYAYTLFQMAGIEAKVLFILKPYVEGEEPDAEAHVVCVFKDGDRWGWLDNERFGGRSYRDMEDIPASIFEKTVLYREVDAHKWLNKKSDDTLLQIKRYNISHHTK